MEKIWHWFESLVPPFPAEERGIPPSGFFRFILFYTQGLWKFLIAIAVLNALLAAGEALFFACMGYIVDWTASSSTAEFFDVYGGRLLLMLLIAGVLLPSVTILHSLLLHQTISCNYPMQVRWQTHRYMLSQSLAFFTDEFAGRVANKIMQTAMAVRTSVLKLIDVMVHIGVYICMMLWMLSRADLLLCIPLAVWLVLYSLSIYVFVPRLRRAASRQSDARSDMVGRIVDSYVNIPTVKLFGGKGREARYARSSMEKFLKSEYGAMRILTMFDVSVQLMNYTLLIVLTMLSLWLWRLGVVTPGSIAIAIAIAIRVINMSRWMMWEVSAIFENIGMVYDGISTLTKPVSVMDPEQPSAVHPHPGPIVFSGVSFGYKGGRRVFADLNLKIEQGEKLGIVGSSGAGKTSLVNLLLRFYDVQSGAITLDGTDIRSFRQDEYRDLFAMVSQDPSLMHRTVGENICYGSAHDHDSMLRAARLTDSLSFIENLSDYRGGHGFDTLVGERGVKLSGGQRQRIALARVVMKNAPILILDEATSALDSESEQVVQENLGKVMEGRTVIAIAHRLSTLAAMDRIVVIDHGRIVESGTQLELIAKGGLFARFWKFQSQGFIGG